MTENPGIQVTDSAMRRLTDILAQERPGSAMRVGVSGGGCSGFQYTFDVVSAPEAGDLKIEREGARIVVDSTSLPFLLGAKIDFVDDLMGQAFKIDNPNATSSCGCGVSFSI